MRDLSTLPKVELHLHLEGTLEPETELELARRNKVELPYADREAASAFGFGDEVMARLARNSVTASFVPEGRKTGLLSEIDAWIATSPN